MEERPLFRADIRRMIHDTLRSGAWMKRSAIVRELCRLHTEAGGAEVSEKSVATAVKKALRQMKDAGEIEGGLDDGTFAHYRLKAAAGLAEAPPTDAKPSPRPGVMEADRVIGQGTERVYCYFYEADRIHAKTQDRVCWPCKVGLASRDAAGRLREQGAITSRAVPAVWALEIRTDDAAGLERAIHRVLKYGTRQTTGGGAEWFLTTPQMVEAIYLHLEAIRCWPE